MATVTILAAETGLAQLIARVEAGEEIILARGKDPVAKIVPLQPAPPKPQGKRQFGALKGSVGPEFFEPLPDEELGSWEF